MHGIDGDLYGFLVGDGAHDLASVVPSGLHDTLPPGFAEAKTHDVVRRLVEGLALGLSALLDGLKNVVVQDYRFCGPMVVPARLSLPKRSSVTREYRADLERRACPWTSAAQ